MNLTDNDKREIIQLIQDNKHLPDKYRFLLFKGREEIELLWNGKSDNFTDLVLPFQIIEHVDEPREVEDIKLQGSLFDDSGRQLKGWTNKLIWGNNNLILSSLINGPLREEIENNGGLKLVYIDPPFDVGDDFNIEIEIGGSEFNRKRNVLEEIAYRDTWGKGSDSFLSMLYERLVLIKRLMSDDGSIYVHCDWRVNSSIRLILDEVFGAKNFQNEIIWQKLTSAKSQTKKFPNIHDSIFYYVKNIDKNIYNTQYVEKSEKLLKTHYRYTDEKTGKRYSLADFTQKGQGEPKKFGDKVLSPPPGKHWIWSQERINEGLKNNLIVFSKSGLPYVKRFYDDSKGNVAEDMWIDINPLNPMAKERVNYPTQKPEALIERIIKTSSNENDLVADFFCGSGTMLAVAERLNRKWIGSDLGKFAIHTARKRMIGIQRLKKEQKENFRAFEILNLGKYQRESFFSNKINSDKEKHYVKLILDAYKAEGINNPVLHGIKNNRYVFVGPINIHVSRKSVETVVEECVKNGITQVDILCFDHEQGLFPNIINEAKVKGVDVACKIIPPDVFDKRAIDKNQVVFHDVAFIEFKPIIKKNKLSIELTGFSVDYSQEKIDEIIGELKPNKSRVILSSGQIIKVSRDKNGIEKKEVITKSWKDWIDYWAVDFDFENKKETFKEKDSDGKIQEKWTGDFIFENEWQSFRNNSEIMEFKSVGKEFSGKKSTKVAVKVIDIFGNDTMRVMKVNL